VYIVGIVTVAVHGSSFLYKNVGKYDVDKRALDIVTVIKARQVLAGKIIHTQLNW
jgi:hypothetical protein